MRLFYRLLIALLVLALFAGDSFAGPLQRLRARRSGGCCGGPVPASQHIPPQSLPTQPAAYGAVYQAAYLAPAYGCPGGRCPAR